VARRVSALRVIYRLQLDPRFYRELPATEAVPMVLTALNEIHDGSVTLRLVSPPPASFRLAPVRLYDAIRFLLEYGLQYCRELRLHIRCKSSDPGTLRIVTNIPGGDLWFQLPDHSSAVAS